MGSEAPEGILSPDGMFYWNGHEWISTLSDDGLHRWNGHEWLPLPPSGSISAPKKNGQAGRIVLGVIALAVVVVVAHPSSSEPARSTPSAVSTPTLDPMAVKRDEVATFDRAYANLAAKYDSRGAPIFEQMSAAQTPAAWRTVLREHAQLIQDFDAEFAAMSRPSEMDASATTLLADDKDLVDLEVMLAGATDAGLRANIYRFSAARDRRRRDMDAFSFQMGFVKGLYGAA